MDPNVAWRVLCDRSASVSERVVFERVREARLERDARRWASAAASAVRSAIGGRR